MRLAQILGRLTNAPPEGRPKSLVYACLDGERQVVCFNVAEGDLVPAEAVPVDPSSLARQRLWRLAQVIERARRLRNVPL